VIRRSGWSGHCATRSFRSTPGEPATGPQRLGFSPLVNGRWARRMVRRVPDVCAVAAGG
jgi:hypothetical protein